MKTFLSEGHATYRKKVIMDCAYLACEQAPGGASAEPARILPNRRCLPRGDCAVNCQISTNQRTPDVKIQN